MQSVLAWSPLDRRHFSYYPSQLLLKRISTDPLAPIGATSASTAVSPQQSLRKAPAVPSEPSAAQGLQAPVDDHSVTYAGASEFTPSFRQGMTGLLTKHASPGSQAQGPAEEAEEVVSRQTQLLLSRFQGSVEVDSIDGLDFYSFSSVEDLNEFARSMDQLLEEQYQEPRSPDESVSSSVARSGAADEEWRETDWAEERQPVVVLPRKTTDITKIKGWRHKAFGPDQTVDQAADHTTRWVMEQMNEQAWRQEEEQKQEPPALMTRRATAAAAAAAAAASGHQGSASNQAAPQPEATIKIDKQENLQAAEMLMSKGVRCAFLSSKLDEFLQHQSELRVVQLAQLNPNILPLPEGQGVLALSNPVLACKGPEGASRQVGPTRQMTSRPSRRYGRPQAADTKRASAGARIEHWNTSAAPAVRRRQHSNSTTDKAAEEPEVPSPSPSKPVASTAAIDDSLPKSPAKRAKIEAEEDAPFLAMTSRRLRGGQVTQDSSLNKAAVASKEGPKKKEPSTLKEPSIPKESSRKKECVSNPVTPSKTTGAVAAKKTAVAASPPAEEALPYGAYEDRGDYPIVPETQFTSEQKRLLQALLTSTQCSRPLQVVVPGDPCFVCPQLDQHDALAAARALLLAEDGTLRKTSTTSGKPGAPSHASAGQKTAQTVGHAVSAPKGANVVKKGRPPSKEAVTKKSTVNVSKTTCKPKVKALSVPAIPTSPPESTQSTRSRRPIRLPARFQDSALYFSPNGDVLDVPLSPTSARQRGRMIVAGSSKVAQPQPPLPPPAPAAPVQPDIVLLSSSSSSCASSPCSSRLSSRSSSPCGSWCEVATASQASSKMNDEGTKTFSINGSRTLKHLARLKTDVFINLHSINDSQASSTPEGSVDINLDDFSDSDEEELSVGDESCTKDTVGNTMKQKACRERIRRQQMHNLLMELQNVVYRTPTTKHVSKVAVLSQANQYLRCLKVLSSHLVKEKRWLKRRQAALKLCLQASCQGTQVPRLPQAEPKPPPVPASVLEVCDLSDCTVPPVREASDELLNGSSDTNSPSALPIGKSKRNGGSSDSKLRHGKNENSSKSGLDKTSKQKAPRPVKILDTGARTRSLSKVEAVTGKESNMETTFGNDSSTKVSFKLNDGHIGALCTIPAPPVDSPKKYTLYPAKGTTLTDLSKVAAAAQQILGPCVIKRVKLRSGQTVYVYGQPEGANASTTDGTLPTQECPDSGAGEEYQPLPSGALSAWQNEQVCTLQLAAPSAVAEPDAQPSLGEEMPEVTYGEDTRDRLLQGTEEDQQAYHSVNVDEEEGDLGDTSEWISGDGDTCIVMKLPVASDEEESSSDES